LLDEGIAERASDVDVVMVHGYGFPKLLGGPLHWAAQQSRAKIVGDVDAMAAASGHGVEAAPNLEEVLKQSE
jgi:3-hydroxyacyl-CoA dehydrogenase